ncbi:MAG: rod shape-determining protein RodA [Rhodospirillaceae bacterium]|nr:rod shape-determining protein RodA [Rhodospirillaceae bacterium]
MRILATFGEPELGLRDRLLGIRWGFVAVVCLLAAVGLAMLYSAAHGSTEPWMTRQAVRFVVALALMLGLAVCGLGRVLRAAYWLYGAALLALIGVDVAGEIGMGAQRWIDLGAFQLQPSEVMKIALVAALARYFHRLDHGELRRPLRLVVPALMVLAPTALVMMQPDLGTAVILVSLGAIMFFLAGVPLRHFLVVGAAAGAALPLAWNSLHDYQRARILTFLDPQTDPLGRGWHILQSKIAFGSGGLFGKGFLHGTQSHLDFLPERQTDFIFTMLAEELGLVGASLVLALYVALLVYGYVIALGSRSHFGRLLALGLTANLFLYVFINMAMVMGLIPVVGVPLPLVSYGGTAQMTVMAGFALLLCVDIDRDRRLDSVGEAG